MNTTPRPKRTFLAVTIMTVLAITTVFMVYAALLASYTGSDVIIQTMGGSIEYSLTKDPGSWGTSGITQGEGAEWYARVNLASPPSQDATVNFILQKQVGGVWTNPPTNVTNFTTNTITLTPSTYLVYACSDGFTIANNYNWGQNTTSTGTYRIVAEINTVP